MGLKALAEAIILQSADDFMDEHRQKEDIAFFGGEGFRICSEIAGMDHSDQCAFLNLLRRRAIVHRSRAERALSPAYEEMVLQA
jgi:hypothetical protein